jgi:hypothetical protein
MPTKMTHAAVNATYSTILRYDRDFTIAVEKFMETAVEVARLRHALPKGWVGKWNRLRGPNGVEVRFQRSTAKWVVKQYGTKIGAYASRVSAVRVGKELA